MLTPKAYFASSSHSKPEYMKRPSPFQESSTVQPQQITDGKTDRQATTARGGRSMEEWGRDGHGGNDGEMDRSTNRWRDKTTGKIDKMSTLTNWDFWTTGYQPQVAAYIWSIFERVWLDDLEVTSCHAAVIGMPNDETATVEGAP